MTSSGLLSTGAIAPNCSLLGFGDGPRETAEAAPRLSDLRGQSVLLAFLPAEWNPSRTEQLSIIYNGLVRAVEAAQRAPKPTGDAATPASGTVLHGLTREGVWCVLKMADGDAVRLPVLCEMTPGGDAARAFGVQKDEHAVFVVDAAGIVRFAYGGAAGEALTFDALLSELQPFVPTAPDAAGEDTQVGGEDTDAALSSPNVWRASRRDFIAATLAGAFAIAAAPMAFASQTAGTASAQTNPNGGTQRTGDTIPVTLSVNGRTHRLRLDPRVTLLDALREHIGLTGSKKGCDHGQCGACTVHIDGQRALSCLALAAQQEGSEIATIEGLAKGDELHPVQAAFVEYDGYQCGYCTPGQIMSAVALLREGRAGTQAEIREGMSGNLCRCAAYPHIIAAVEAARNSGKRI